MLYQSAMTHSGIAWAGALMGIGGAFFTRYEPRRAYEWSSQAARALCEGGGNTDQYTPFCVPLLPPPKKNAIKKAVASSMPDNNNDSRDAV